MTKNQNPNVLTAVDFLSLAEQKTVARIDLADAGYKESKIIYVADLSASQQQSIFNTSGNSGKVRSYKDQSYEVSLADMPKNSAAKFLSSCLVLPADGVDFEEMFSEAATDDQEFAAVLIVPETDLVYMSKFFLEHFGNKRKMNDFLNTLPNKVTNHITKVVREISGIGTDTIGEKKDS